jgi:hypothetical protein
VAVSFIGGGNQITWKKPPTCRKSLTNFQSSLYGAVLDHGFIIMSAEIAQFRAPYMLDDIYALVFFAK